MVPVVFHLPWIKTFELSLLPRLQYFIISKVSFPSPLRSLIGPFLLIALSLLGSLIFMFGNWS